MPIEPARFDSATGRYLALDYNTVNSLYVGGVGGTITYDMSSFMKSTIAAPVRPTDFGGFNELFAIAAARQASGETGSLNIVEYYRSRAIEQGLTGAKLDDYMKLKVNYAFNFLYTGDTSEQGRFDQYLWGSVSFRISGEIKYGAGVTFDGEIRAFDDKFRFQSENKNILMTYALRDLEQAVDPGRTGREFSIEFRGEGRRYSGYDTSDALIDGVSSRARAAAYESNSSIFNVTYARQGWEQLQLMKREATPGMLNQGISRSIIQCFSAGTPILMADRTTRPIESLDIGDVVFAFDQSGQLVPSPIYQLLRGSTTEWIELECGLRVTPNHRFLRPNGRFAPVGEILGDDRLVVGADGRSMEIRERRRISYDNSASNRRHLTEEQPSSQAATEWHTFNMAVQEHHTYIAGGYRVHNKCVYDTELVEDVVFNSDGSATVVVRDAITGNRSEIDERLNEAGNTVAIGRRTYFADNNPSYVTTSWNQFDSAGQPTGPAQVGLTWKVANGTSFDDPNIYTGPLGATAVQWNHTVVGGHDAYSMQFVDVNQNPLLSITAKPNPQQSALMNVALTEYADGQPTAIGNIDYSNSSNDPFKQATFKNAITGQIIEREIETQDGTSVQNDASGMSVTLPLNNSPAVGRWNTEVQPEDHTYSLVGDQIGAVLGSTLGQVLAGHASGGEQAFARIAGNTALATVLGTVGRSLDSYFNDGSATNGDFSASVGLALDHVGTMFGSALRTAGTGFISSFLTAELAESLHIDATSFGGALFSYATNTAVSGVLNAALVNLNLGLDVTAGFGGNLFSGATNIAANIRLEDGLPCVARCHRNVISSANCHSRYRGFPCRRHPASAALTSRTAPSASCYGPRRVQRSRRASPTATSECGRATGGRAVRCASSTSWRRSGAGRRYS